MLEILHLLLALSTASAATKSIETPNGKYEVIETKPAYSRAGTKSPLLVIAPAKEYTMTGKIFERLADRAAELGFFVVRFNWKFVTEKKKPAADFKAESKDLATILDFYSKQPQVDSEHVILAAKSFGSRAAMVDGVFKKAAALLFMTPNCDATNTFEKTYGGAFDFDGPVQIVISVLDPYCDVQQIYAAAGKFSKSVTLFTLAGDHNFATGDATSQINEDAALVAMSNWLAQLR